MKQLKCDVLVTGGGPGGLPAALASARNGAKVILCQDRSVLGGNASSEVRMHMVGADCSGKRGEYLSVEARESGIIEELRLEACVRNPQRSPSIFDLIWYDKCRQEPNLTLMLNTRVERVEVRYEIITKAFARRPSTEDEFEIEAKIFIDCTGDGTIGAGSGAPYYEGRESKSTFGEDLGQDKADNLRLGSSLMFQAKKHDRPMPFSPPAWARKVTEEDLALRPHATPAMDMDLGLEYGYWWLEWGGTLDTIKDNEIIRDELLAILLGVWDHVKNGGDHGAENWALEWCGFLPGKRESRRFVGQYTLSQKDIQGATLFEDAIAFGGWHMDLHPPSGVDAIKELPCIHHEVPQLYQIPLRACISKKIRNLMFAGRNISASHVAFASTRVMATCAVVGQGVGTAAALALRDNTPPLKIFSNKKLISQIQQQLIKEDAFIPGVVNEDPTDLAKVSKIQCSSEQEIGPAINVISGQNRSVHGKRGVRSQIAFPGTHRWMSDSSCSLPAWIQMSWEKPKNIRSIQLTFDTGSHRVLTFSLADEYTRKMHWGMPQPETVKKYRLETFLNGRCQEVLEEDDNYHRHRIHNLKGKPADQLVVTILATNGIDHARVIEIRVYE
ncbi:FAD dependent oxidoreductase [Cyclobacterium lianum]|uniref:FAD dependent oxidoreductase n=1 Tax=Cyclobacterium lianum TaxID=388280 RepID=A0A1M7QPI5_9BACT|nr:FAD-dependent oxidoreductase [Cyclobacterium lianum]SHN33073.1 FAD dependent oxidoreductase [Cyclobacterium lianum]